MHQEWIEYMPQQVANIVTNKSAGMNSITTVCWPGRATKIALTVCAVVMAFVLTSTVHGDEPNGTVDNEQAVTVPVEPMQVRAASSPVSRHLFDPISGEVVMSESAASVMAVGSTNPIYANTDADLLFPPGEGRLIADDLFTAPGCDCLLDSYEFLVGGGDADGPFSVTFALYDGCPNNGGLEIPGTGGTIELPDDGDHLISIDLSTLDLTKEAAYWLGMSFDRGGAGWYSGTPANVGFTGNLYDFPAPGFECSAKFPPTLYAGFNVAISCTPQTLTAAMSPVPGDGELSLVDAPLLQWDQENAQDNAGGQPGGNAAAVPADWDGTWDRQVPPGQTCGTMERYNANLPAGAGEVAGGCEEGLCDDAATRDFFIPEPSDAKRYRLAFIVFCDDDGTNCTASLNEIAGTVAIMNQNFAPWEVEFVHETYFVNNTEFRFFDSSEEVEMKNTYAISPATQINIFVVQTTGFSFGTFPWDPNALTPMGGIVLHTGHVGTAIASHEVGHNLGLWHTHHGVSEVVSCSNCYERADGINADKTGDFCSDTAATPVNFNCSNPGGVDGCSTSLWGETNFRNYMGYAPPGCYNEFTPQQAGRFHCWTQQVLLGWTETASCTATYDVYIGTENPPTDLICEDVLETECQAPEFEPGSTVYWQVVTKLEDQSTASPVWSYLVPGGVCDLVATVPGSCSIDGMQPHDPNVLAVGTGPTEIDVQFTCETVLIDLVDFTITSDMGEAPQIIDLESNGFQLTLTLDRPLPAGAWTCFEFEPTGRVDCVGMLPGDVNGDRTSNADDLAAIMATLNGIDNAGSPDLDRSGTVGPEDILRLMDLLNGAGNYDRSWWGESLPDCPE